MTEIPDELVLLAKAQHGLLTRRQAIQHLSEDRLARLVGPNGRWHIPLRGIIATFTGALSDQQRLYGAWMYAGPNSMITSFEGCRKYKLRNLPPPGDVKLLIGAARRRQSRGFVVVQRASFLPKFPRVFDDVPVAPLPRCVLDAGRDLSDLDAVRALITESVQRRLATTTQLLTELEQGAVAWSARPRRVLAEVVQGARSVPEAEFVALMASSTVLPRMHHNCTLLTPDGEFLCVPDGYLKEVGIVGEVQSMEHHLDPLKQEEDMGRRARMARYDVLAIEFRPTRLRRDGSGLLSDFESAYEERRADGKRSRVILRCRPECPLRIESDR